MNNAQRRSAVTAMIFALLLNGLLTFVTHYKWIVQDPDPLLYALGAFLGTGVIALGVPVCVAIVFYLAAARFTIILGISVLVMSAIVSNSFALEITKDIPELWYVWAAITALFFGVIMVFSYPRNDDQSVKFDSNIDQTDLEMATTIIDEAKPELIAVNIDTKLCPFCAEEVKALAIKCKHCQSDISHTVE